jgi:predicted dehydrogenase
MDIQRRNCMKQLNIGLIGGGFMGKAHSLAYAAMPMFFWPAPALPVRKLIADVNEELAQEAALRFGFQSSTGDWHKVIEDTSIDIVDIAVPNNLHHEMVIAAAQAGKHILCEKPLARNGLEAQVMYEAVKRARVVHMVPKARKVGRPSSCWISEDFRIKKKPGLR